MGFEEAFESEIVFIDSFDYTIECGFGDAKVSLHLMFGAIAIFADQLIRLAMIETV